MDLTETKWDGMWWILRQVPMAGSREHRSLVLGPREFDERLLPFQDEFFVA